MNTKSRIPTAQQLVDLSESNKFLFISLLVAMVTAALCVSPSLTIERYFFPDNEMIAEYSDLTAEGTKPISELELLNRYFVDPGGDAKYRPLGNLAYLLKYYGIIHVTPYFGVWCNFASIFLCAFLLIQLTRRAMGASSSWAFITPIVYCLSPVFLGQSLLHVVAEDALVIAFSLSIIIIYLRARETQRPLTWIWCWLSTILFPLFKEPIIAASAAVCLAEFFSKGTPHHRRVGAAISGFIAAYPAFLPTLILKGEIPQPRVSTNFIHSEGLYWAAAQHLISQIGPTIVVLSAIGIIHLHRSRTIKDTFSGYRNMVVLPTPKGRLFEQLGQLRVLPGLSIVLVCGIATCLIDPSATPIAGFHPNFQLSLGEWEQGYIPKDPLALGAFIAIATLLFFAAPQNLSTMVVAIYAGGTAFGLVRYYFIDHHLMYVMPGISVIMVAELRKLHSALKQSHNRLILHAFSLCLIMGLSQKPANIINTARFTHSADKLANKLASDIKDNPAIIISNSVFAEDLAYLSTERCGRQPRSWFSVASKGATCWEESRTLETRYSAVYGKPFIVVRNKHIKDEFDFNRFIASADMTFLLHNAYGYWRFWPFEKTNLRQNFVTVSKNEMHLTLLNVDVLFAFIPGYFWTRPVAPDWFREVSIRGKGIFRKLVFGADLYKANLIQAAPSHSSQSPSSEKGVSNAFNVKKFESR